MQMHQRTALPSGIPRAQRCALKTSLAEFAKTYTRNEAMARVYLSGQHTMHEIAQHFDVYVYYSTVSRAVKTFEQGMSGCKT